MAASISVFISGIGLMLATTLTPAFSATLVQGGVIHFRGQIVEDPCNITSRHQQVEMSCPENGRMQTRQINFQDVEQGQTAFPYTTKVSMKYLNAEKSLAIMQIDYN